MSGFECENYSQEFFEKDRLHDWALKKIQKMCAF